MADDGISLFALDSTRSLGERVADALGVVPADHEEREFEDGEHKARPLESVRGQDVYVLQSLHGDDGASPNDKLLRLLFFLGAVGDAGAGRVTAVVPYLCYARKDRKTKSRDPVTTRYVAALFESVAVDRVVALEVHNLIAFQNAFRCATEHLESRRLFVDHFAETLPADAPLTVVSPDVGGVKRADAFREMLAARLGREVGLAFLEKRRSEGVVSGEAVVGELDGRTAVIFDDLISTGTTINRAASALRDRGVSAVYAAAAHGLFVGEAGRLLAAPGLDGLAITDSVPPFRLEGTPAMDGLQVVGCAPYLAEAIRRLHEDGSLVALGEL